MSGPNAPCPKKFQYQVEPYAKTGVLNEHKGVTDAQSGQRDWVRMMSDERKPVGQQKAMEAAATRKKPNVKPAKLGRDVQARLGQQLRAMYDEVVNQGVPDRFTELLNRIDQTGTKEGQ